MHQLRRLGVSAAPRVVRLTTTPFRLRSAGAACGEGRGGACLASLRARLRPEALTIDRAQFIRELESRNIGTSVHFIPVHLHPYYRDKYGYAAGDFPVAYENYRRLLSLPLSPRLTDEDLADVIEAVLQVVKRNWR